MITFDVVQLLRSVPCYPWNPVVSDAPHHLTAPSFSEHLQVLCDAWDTDDALTREQSLCVYGLYLCDAWDTDDALTREQSLCVYGLYLCDAWDTDDALTREQSLCVYGLYLCDAWDTDDALTREQSLCVYGLYLCDAWDTMMLWHVNSLYVCMVCTCVMHETPMMLWHVNSLYVCMVCTCVTHETPMMLWHRNSLSRVHTYLIMNWVNGMRIWRAVRGEGSELGIWPGPKSSPYPLVGCKRTGSVELGWWRDSGRLEIMEVRLLDYL